MITPRSIGTLIVFIFSIACVIHPLTIPFPRFSAKLNLKTAPILSILILWAAQCLGPTEIRHGIVGVDGVKPYNILILFFSLAYMAITLDITGVLQAAAFWVGNRSGTNGWRLYFYFYALLTTLSVVVGNDPVILSGTLFLVYYIRVRELHPIPWLISEFAAANTASMVLFVGNPTNVVICEGFNINNVAFTAYTILPFLACSVGCFGALAAQFHNAKYVPKQLAAVDDLDVRSVLLDPKGALVGSILLGTCLGVIIVVSFFKVDVWEITLPFALTKLVFDFAWDHYRFVNDKIPMHRGQPRSATLDDLDASPTLSNISLPKKSSPRSRQRTLPSPIETSFEMTGSQSRQNSHMMTSTIVNSPLPTPPYKSFFGKTHSDMNAFRTRFHNHFPTISTALPRLPFALVPFAFSQFILIEALARQGWIEIFATWLVRASRREVFPTIWLIGVLGVVLCNISGTNIGATILLTKVVRAARFPAHSARAAAIALAVASNIGAVSFTFSASLAGLLWQTILKQKNIKVRQRKFAMWNSLPLFVMTTVGLGVVCAEMAVLERVH